MLMITITCTVLGLTPARRLEEATAEEHPENLVGVDLLLELALAEASTSAARGLHVAGLFSCLVIYVSLLSIGQTSIGSTHFLECFVSLWRSIFVGM